MKTLLLRSLALAVVAGSLCFAQAASAAAVVSYYGLQNNMSQWRSTSVTKTITTPGGDVLAPNNYYGADGYTAINVFSMPSYISAQSIGASSYIDGGYAPINNPAFPVAPVVADMASSLLYQIPGAGAESSPLFAFTVGANAPASFLMGIAYGQLPSPSEDTYLGSSFRVAVGASSASQATVANNGIIDWMFFKIDGATSGNVINIYGTGSSVTGYADLAAVSFDTIPEPGTYALLGLAGFGLALHRLRRRRRTS
jgi:PEP-CTERM motif